jgi:hypothetical protein
MYQPKNKFDISCGTFKCDEPLAMFDLMHTRNSIEQAQQNIALTGSTISITM